MNNYNNYDTNDIRLQLKSSGSRLIKKAIIDRQADYKQIANAIGLKSVQSLSNKLYRDTWPFSDVVKILDMLGYDLKVVEKDYAEVKK